MQFTADSPPPPTKFTKRYIARSINATLHFWSCFPRPVYPPVPSRCWYRKEILGQSEDNMISANQIYSMEIPLIESEDVPRIA